MHKPISWYDNTLDQICGDGSRRHAAEQSTPRPVDPYVTGLARALAVAAGRVPLIP